MIAMRHLKAASRFYATGAKIDSRVRTANLLQDATSAEPKPGVFAIVRGIRARSANVVLQTSQSLASQITSQIAGPEINVTFRYSSKKVRRVWGISQVIIDLILGWFLKTTQMKTRGSTELLFKNLLYDVHKEKVWRS